MEFRSRKIIQVSAFHGVKSINPEELHLLLSMIHLEYTLDKENYCCVNIIGGDPAVYSAGKIENWLLELSHLGGLDPDFLDWIEKQDKLQINNLPEPKQSSLRS